MPGSAPRASRFRSVSIDPEPGPVICRCSKPRDPPWVFPAPIEDISHTGPTIGAAPRFKRRAPLWLAGRTDKDYPGIKRGTTRQTSNPNGGVARLRGRDAVAENSRGAWWYPARTANARHCTEKSPGASPPEGRRSQAPQPDGDLIRRQNSPSAMKTCPVPEYTPLHDSGDCRTASPPTMPRRRTVAGALALRDVRTYIAARFPNGDNRS